MKVLNSFYNVLTVKVEESITLNTPTIIGTLNDYEMIKRITAKSGILRAQANIGGAAMCGTCSVNPSVDSDMIECTCVTNYLGNLQAVIVLLQPVEGGMQATFTIKALES